MARFLKSKISEFFPLAHFWIFFQLDGLQDPCDLSIYNYIHEDVYQSSSISTLEGIYFSNQHPMVKRAIYHYCGRTPINNLVFSCVICKIQPSPKYFYFSLFCLHISLDLCTNCLTFSSSIYYQKVFVLVASKKEDHFVWIPQIQRQTPHKCKN